MTNKYIYISLFILGIIGFYSVAFADVCNTTVKCVCESNSLRVVPCPAEFSNDVIDCTKEGIPQGTCAVDCGQQAVAASCAEIPIECRNNETANCLVTLPIEAHSGCPFNEINCSGQCVDLSSDPNNCGSCGSSCPLFEECVSGVCMQPSCPTDLVFCSGAGCVDLSSDSNNCGLCGSACAFSQTCIDGACTASSCLSDADCIPGQYCDQSNQCVTKKGDGNTCAENNECASGNCVDGYCCNTPCGGACDFCDLLGAVGTCSIDSTCCSDPAAGDFCPGDGCVDFGTDENNCGGCDVQCTFLQTCSAGTCIP